MSPAAAAAQSSATRPALPGHAASRSRFVWRGGQLYLRVTSSHGGFYTLRFEDPRQIARLKPVPTPGNEDDQD